MLALVDELLELELPELELELELDPEEDAAGAGVEVPLDFSEEPLEPFEEPAPLLGGVEELLAARLSVR